MAWDCAKNYPDLEWFVSENGIGIMDEYKNRDAEGTIQDDYRVDFVRQHLEWVAKAIDEGAKCRGYHYWAVIDNWSWANAFKNRYGFVEVDLMDGYKRRLKKSAPGSNRSPRPTWLISDRRTPRPRAAARNTWHIWWQRATDHRAHRKRPDLKVRSNHGQ